MLKNIRSTVIKLILGVSVCVIALAFGYSVNAAPINGATITVEQPNGTEIELTVNGDEFFSWFTDSYGNIVVKNTSDLYVYASLIDGAICPTNYVVYPDTPPSSGGGTWTPIQINDIPTSIIEDAYENSPYLTSSNIMPLSMIPMNSGNDFVNNEINNIVVFIEFSNKTFTQKTRTYYEGLFNTNTSSVKNYFNEVSYGKTQLNSTFYPQTSGTNILFYKDINPASYYESSSYGGSSSEQAAREQALFKRALDSVKSEIPTTFNIDRNADGYVDMVTFIVCGDLMSGSNEVRWPHQWNFWGENVTTVNGKSTNRYVIIPEAAVRGLTASDGTSTYQNGSAIFCHESLHVIGFPDLYYYYYLNDTNSGNSQDSSSYWWNIKAMGYWDIMSGSNGAHASAYIKSYYGGWMDIPEISSNGTYTLNPITSSTNNAYVIRSPLSTNEYFVLEYRRKTGTFEANVQGTGLVVYRVKADCAPNGNRYASLVRGGDAEIWQMTYQISGSMTLNFSNGTSSGITISGISANNTATASFTIAVPTTMIMNYFKDQRLVNAICAAVGKSQSQVTLSDLTALTSLTISKNDDDELGINLTGIQYLTGLTTLIAENCGIEDISLLSSLTNLTNLQLRDNNISNITSLTNLTKLRTLRLRGNLINSYTATQGYYSLLTTKDYSLSNLDDVVFRIPNFTTAGQLGTAYATLTSFVPQYIYYTIEAYNSSGVLLERRKSYVYASGTQTSFSVPASSVCGNDGSYVVLTAYERSDYRQQMSRLIIKQNAFDLSVFN